MAPIVAKWGNSLAVRLPSQIAKRSGITAGDEVEITSTKQGSFTVSLARPKYRLRSLVDQITPDNTHGETDWGGPKGGEAW